MRTVVLCFAVLSCAAVGMAQGNPGGAPMQPRAGSFANRRPAGPGAQSVGRPNRQNTTIPPNAPLVTLDGICSAGKNEVPSSACKTTLTRAQLEHLMDDLGMDPSPTTRHQFVINYARLLAASELAKQRHLDTNPAVAREMQVQLELTRMQVLTTSLLQGVQEEAERIPPAEIQQYYTDHQGNFEQAVLRRLSVPTAAPTSSGQPLDSAVVKAKLEELRDRSAAAEDFSQLQQELYSTLGITAPLPPTKLTLMHRENLTPEEAHVFELKAGEVSGVLESPGTLSILKLVSKNMISMESARTEIEAVLLSERLQRELHEATKGVKADFNLKYLEQPTEPELFPASLLGPKSLSRGTLSTMRSRP